MKIRTKSIFATGLAGTLQVGYPHKEVLVDLTGWHWKGNGPYLVNFVVKDFGGATLGQKSVNVFVY